MQRLPYLVGFLILISLYACGDGNVLITPDPTVQLEEDIALIHEYLEEKGYSLDQIDTTETEVRYVILEEGDGDPITETDIVSFNYTGMLLNDTIFDTSIESVGDSIRAHFLEDSVGLADKSVHTIFLNSYTESRTYAPFNITYSSTGWPFNGRFINGFSSGISASFSRIKTGGKVLVVLPSGTAYGTVGSGALIPGSTAIAFELFPIAVKPQ